MSRTVELTLADVLGTATHIPAEVSDQQEFTFDINDPESFAKAIVSSPEYRASLRRRLILGELAPAVECRILDYCFGKPTERVEHSGRIDHTITRVERVIVEPVIEEVVTTH